MKIARLVFALAALAFGSNGWGQSLYPLFGPSAGIMVGNVSTPVTVSATSANVLSLWSGTCSSSTFLNGAGACAAPAGTGVSSVALTAPSVFSVTGSPVTSSGTLALAFATGQTANQILATPNGTTGAISLRSIVLADLPLINVVGGGTGLGTLAAHGVLLGEGTSNVSPLVLGADTVLRGTASADPVGAAVPNCGSSTTALNYNTTTHAFGCQTITVGGTGTVTSITAGTAISLSPSPITTTGSVSLDTTASPTITGAWTFTPSAAVTALTVNQNATAGIGMLVTGAAAIPVFSRVQTTSASNGAAAGFSLQEGTDTAALEMFNAATTPAPVTGGPTGESLVLATNQNVPLVLGTNAVARLFISGAGLVENFETNFSTSGFKNTSSYDSGTFTGTLTGMTTATTGTINWVRSGNIVTLYALASITGTSNTTAMSLTGLPAVINPTASTQKVVCGALTDAGVGDQAGQCFVLNTNSIAFTLINVATGAYSRAFTATGTKGFTGGISVTYSLQ